MLCALVEAVPARALHPLERAREGLGGGGPRAVGRRAAVREAADERLHQGLRCVRGGFARNFL